MKIFGWRLGYSLFFTAIVTCLAALIATYLGTPIEKTPLVLSLVIFSFIVYFIMSTLGHFFETWTCVYCGSNNNVVRHYNRNKEVYVCNNCYNLALNLAFDFLLKKEQ